MGLSSSCSISQASRRPSQAPFPVKYLQEFFGDYVVLDPHHFVVPVSRPECLLSSQPFAWDYASSSDAVSRMTEGLAALALSLRRRFQIRCRCSLRGQSI